MSIEIQLVSDQINTAFEQWQLLIKLFRKSDAMISIALSRLERGDELRANSPSVALGEKAYRLAKASQYEIEAHTYLSVIPDYHEFFRLEIIKIQDQIEEELNHE